MTSSRQSVLDLRLSGIDDNLACQLAERLCNDTEIEFLLLNNTDFTLAQYEIADRLSLTPLLTLVGLTERIKLINKGKEQTKQLQEEI
ncbi:MAG: hypothetical protein EZS28_011361 [Streblomastix strix]|uniref:Uncharacterized protein n=1 Tax=Streblomastix strix TaxID=222440 RepID=A0A5J4WF10_9EUKA|nr:MAG: hypothetical protein EZS28_011361 [Streblomastix strix]